MEDLKNTQEMTLVAEAYTRYRTLLVAYGVCGYHPESGFYNRTEPFDRSPAPSGSGVGSPFLYIRHPTGIYRRDRVGHSREQSAASGICLDEDASRSVPESILHEPFRRTDGRRNIEGTSYQPPYGGGADTERAEKGASLSQGCRRLLTGRQKNHLP